MLSGLVVDCRSCVLQTVVTWVGVAELVGSFAFCVCVVLAPQVLAAIIRDVTLFYPAMLASMHMLMAAAEVDAIRNYLVMWSKW